VIYKLSGIVSEDAVKHAIRARVPKGTEELNLQAFRTGVELAEGWLKEHAK
jgi:Pyruvate/2-oxoacid:ferredoxin oxidoreductase gamma subunit